jgi:predicted MFS family arabinose efflux permease
VGTLALSVLVYRRTGSVFGSAGFFLCAQAAPALLSPSLVARLDRLSPRRTLPALYALEAVLYAVLAWLTGRFMLAPVLVLALVDGAVALVARSIASAARTEILKPVDLVPEGGALTSTMFSIAYLGGPAVSGLVVAAGGTGAALLVSCGLFAAMSISLVSHTLPQRIVHDGPEKGRVRAAIAHARHDPALATLLTTQAVMFILYTIPVPIEVVFADHTIHAGASGYGWLLSAWGAGAVVGSLSYTRWRRTPVRVLLSVGSAFMGIGCGVLAVAPGLGVALVGAACAGIANGVVEASLSTELQNITDQSWVALVSSLSQSIGQLMPGLGIILGATIAALASVRISFGTAAVGSFVGAVAIAVLFTPQRLGRGPGSGPPGDVPEPEPRPEPHAGTFV